MSLLMRLGCHIRTMFATDAYLCRELGMAAEATVLDPTAVQVLRGGGGQAQSGVDFGSGGAGQQEVARRWRVVLRYRERGTGIKRSEENAL